MKFFRAPPSAPPHPLHFPELLPEGHYRMIVEEVGEPVELSKFWRVLITLNFEGRRIYHSILGFPEGLELLQPLILPFVGEPCGIHLRHRTFGDEHVHYTLRIDWQPLIQKLKGK